MNYRFSNLITVLVLISGLLVFSSCDNENDKNAPNTLYWGKRDSYPLKSLVKCDWRNVQGYYFTTSFQLSEATMEERKRHNAEGGVQGTYKDVNIGVNNYYLEEGEVVSYGDISGTYNVPCDRVSASISGHSTMVGVLKIEKHSNGDYTFDFKGQLSEINLTPISFNYTSQVDSDDCEDKI